MTSEYYENTAYNTEDCKTEDCMTAPAFLSSEKDRLAFEKLLDKLVRARENKVPLCLYVIPEPSRKFPFFGWISYAQSQFDLEPAEYSYLKDWTRELGPGTPTLREVSYRGLTWKVFYSEESPDLEVNLFAQCLGIPDLVMGC